MPWLLFRLAVVVLGLMASSAIAAESKIYYSCGATKGSLPIAIEFQDQFKKTMVLYSFNSSRHVLTLRNDKEGPVYESQRDHLYLDLQGRQSCRLAIRDLVYTCKRAGAMTTSATSR